VVNKEDAPDAKITKEQEAVKVNTVILDAKQPDWDDVLIEI
jgi:hypothetical protein